MCINYNASQLFDIINKIHTMDIYFLKYFICFDVFTSWCIYKTVLHYGQVKDILL